MSPAFPTSGLPGKSYKSFLDVGFVFVTFLKSFIRFFFLGMDTFVCVCVYVFDIVFF